MPIERIVVTPDFPWRDVPYLPIRRHRESGLVDFESRGVFGRWPTAEELGRIALRLQDEEVYRAFGFVRPPTEAMVRGSVLPYQDSGKVEPVEILFCEEPKSGLTGFVVLYELERSGDPRQEIDFALLDPGSGNLPESLFWGVLAYLFAVRGAQSMVKEKIQLKRGPDGLLVRTVRRTRTILVDEYFREVIAPRLVTIGEESLPIVRVQRPG